MRKTFYFIAALAALASCQKDVCNEGVTAEGDAPACFKASYDDIYTPDAETRMTFNASTFTFAWEDADRIVVNGATYKRDNDNELFRYYSGGYTTNADGSVVGVYPASVYGGGTAKGSAKWTLPYSYTWNTSTGRIDYIPVAGKADADGNISFKNLVSLFKVTVTNGAGVDCYLKSVTLSSDKSMSGDFSMTFAADGVPTLAFVSSGTVYPSVSMDLDNVVKLTTGDSYTVYLPVPAQAYTKFNVKVMMYTAAGESYEDMRFYNSSATTQTGKSETVTSLTCKRGSIYGLNVNVSSLSKGIEGDGTAVNPYKIGSVEDLKYVQLMVKNASEVSYKHFASSHYKLTADITLEGPWTKAMSFSAVDGSNGFEGVFDGDGHTIDATAATNTSPVFWDTKGAVIKHLSLKGDFDFWKDICTLSPFFAAGFDVTMVAVMFEGSINNSTLKQSGWGGLSVFGAYAGNSNVTGCYAKAEIDSVNASWTRYAYQMFGQVSSSYMGRKGPYSLGVIGDLSRAAGVGTTGVPLSVHSVNDTIKAYATAPTAEEEMNELHQAICDWNDNLKSKLAAGKITQEEFDRKVSRYTYSIVEGKLKLVDKNE